MRDASGGPGRGGPGRGEATEELVAKVQAQGPAELRPPGAQVAAGWGNGDRGGQKGVGGAETEVTRSRGGSGQTRPVSSSRAPGRWACGPYSSVGNGGDTGFSLVQRASGAKQGRPRVSRPEPGVDFSTQAHQGHCHLLWKVACCG